MSDDEREMEEIYDADDLDEIKQVNKSPALDQIKMIPIGKCLVIKRNVNGVMAEIEVCRKAENEWKINGPHPFGDSEMKLKDMKPQETE
jgi:hypothetical protein